MVRAHKKLFDWLVRGKDGHVYLVQLPNLPIICWAAFGIVSNLAPTGLKTGFANLSFAFLAIWCYLEITRGMSRFRQILGVVVAMVLVWSLFK